MLAEVSQKNGRDYRVASGGGRMTTTMDRYEAETGGRVLAIAHNGNITNAVALRDEMEAAGQAVLEAADRKEST